MVTHQTLTVALVLSTPAFALAERVPERREDAALVVRADVKAVFGKDRGDGLGETHTDFVVQLQVEAVEKGRGAKPGETLYAHCFQRTRNALIPLPGMAGHNQVPKPGERIRAYLNNHSGVYEFAYPDGLDRLDGGPGGRVVESPMGGSLWGYLGTFLLGALAAVLFFVWRGMRKAEQRQPVATVSPERRDVSGLEHA